MKRRTLETLLGGLTILFVLLPLLAHLPANDNHKNLANHHYGQNLMNTLEPWSIFMTEGGDNQVFTSAYNQMAEQLRPDVRIYDQKGNVFYRIYGDFRFMTRQEVDIKRNVVDFEIFKRGRPVYLTWRRSPQVAVCGDWYLKRYGILYKVMPLRYRILEDLSADIEIPLNKVSQLIRSYYKKPAVIKEMKASLKALNGWYIKAVQNGTIETGDRYNRRIHFMNKEEQNRIQKNVLLYRDYLQKALARRIDQTFVNNLLNRLQQEGYLKIEGQTVKFVKPLPSPMKGGYWKAYADRIDYSDIPNSVYWDYLTREILTNYNFYLAQYAKEQQSFYKRRLAYYLRKQKQQPGNRDWADKIAAARQKIKYFKGREQYAYKQAENYGYDMTPILHNLGAVFSGKEDYKKAMELYRKGVEANKYSYPTVFAYIQTGLKYYAEKGDAAGEAKFVDKAEKLVDRTIPLLLHQEGVTKDNLKKNTHYRRLIYAKQRLLVPRKKYPLSKLQNYLKVAQSRPQDSTAWKNYLRMLSLRRDYHTIITTFKRISGTVGWNDPGILYTYGTALYSSGKHDDAIEVFRKTTAKFPLHVLSSFRYGELLQLRGRKKQAVQAFNRLLTIKKGPATAKYPQHAKFFDGLMNAARSRVQQLQ